MTNDECETRREDRLLKRYHSYRGVFVGAAFLCGTMILAYFLLPEESHRSGRLPEFAISAAFFWAAIASYAQARLAHIRTIRRYRGLHTA